MLGSIEGKKSAAGPGDGAPAQRQADTERERAADEREHAADERQRELDERRRALGEAVETLEQRTLETIERSRALLALSGERLSR